ncbi:hypothetical protein CYMTET_55955 [Cymbomonas tetramitiformis]|uniref:Uncharacterized protein n=1 Tax=Cymbomonas tetramitiformis TaxID=36881 RepID=A0AAE0BBY2_9CHLO|nr:hypothetical protein CYMTET_55955 [Cymbomonas tetramitiformis]
MPSFILFAVPSNVTYISPGDDKEVRAAKAAAHGEKSLEILPGDDKEVRAAKAAAHGHRSYRRQLADEKLF